MSKIKISKKQHNEIFNNRKWTWKNRFEYVREDDSIRLTEYYSSMFITVVTITIPFTIVLNLFWVGIKGILEAKLSRDFKELFKKKKRSGIITKGSISYIKLVEKGLFDE